MGPKLQRMLRDFMDGLAGPSNPRHLTPDPSPPCDGEAGPASSAPVTSVFAGNRIVPATGGYLDASDPPAADEVQPGR